MKTDFVEISKIVRRKLIKTRYENGSGHTSGPLGIVDMLVSLYFGKMNIDMLNIKNENRDRLILSGYQFPAVFCTLNQKGLISDDLLKEMDCFNSNLKPNKNVSGFEISSYSSLGQGLSIANGIALALKLKNNHSSKVYVILGDGEMNEGQIWEALFTTLHYKLDNLVIIINKNDIQNDDFTKNIKKIDFTEVLRGMNFNVINTDGNNPYNFLNDLNELENINNGKPRVLISKTIKGKGISFMEDNPFKYHAGSLSKEEYERAIDELK